MQKIDFLTARAYANGALDGYNTGKNANPYTHNANPYDDEENGFLYFVYESGYQYGVALYCFDNEGANNE